MAARPVSTEEVHHLSLSSSRYHPYDWESRTAIPTRIVVDFYSSTFPGLGQSAIHVALVAKDYDRVSEQLI